MAANRVEIDITAEDRASGVIANLQRNLGGLGGSAGIAQVALGNIASTAMLAGLQAVSSAINGIVNGLTSAAKMETSFLSAAKGISLNLKVDFSEAEEMQKRIATTISKLAATQPGEDSDYLAFSNGLSDSL